MTPIRFFPLLVLVALAETALSAAEPIPAVPDVISRADQLFPLDQVQLLPGFVKDKQDLTFQYLLSLDPQRFLYNFRSAAGLPVGEVKPYGGWESATGFCKGHFTGHYLSACSEAFAVTGNPQFKAKCDELVSGLAECQKAFGTGYLFTNDPVTFDSFVHGTPMPEGSSLSVPFYTVHKIMAGLLDCYRYTGNPQALKIVCGMADFFGKQLASSTPAQLEHLFDTSKPRPHNEFGGMSEVMHNLYATTGNTDYLNTARLFDREWFLEPLLEDKDQLAGLHANCHIPIVIGACRDYEITGKSAPKNEALNFWHLVVPARTFNNGGSSGPDPREPKSTPYGEHWPPADMLEQSLSATMSESCVAHNLLKLTAHLFTWKPSPEFAAYYERTYFNTVLGTEGSTPGRYIYSLPLISGSHKQFGSPESTFWCCYGTGVEAHAQLAQAIYYHSLSELWVNLYVASQLTWKEQDLQLIQTTNFPFQPTSTFVLHLAKPTELTFHFYIPAWTSQPKLTLNGSMVADSLRPGTFTNIHQTFHDGDTLLLTLPMTLRTERLASNSDFTSVFYGPILLTGITDKPLMTACLAPLGNPSAFLANFTPKPIDAQLTFQYSPSNAPMSNITFRPLFLINDDKTRYTTFFQPSLKPAAPPAAAQPTGI